MKDRVYFIFFLIASILFWPLFSQAQTLLLQESFEGTGCFVANEFDDGGNDYFMDGNQTIKPATLTWLDYHGTYLWIGEDTDGGADAADNVNPLGFGEAGYVVLSKVYVAAYASVKLNILLGAGGVSSHENVDYLKVQYAFDGDIAPSGASNVNQGTYTTLACFRGINPPGGSPSLLKLDTDNDGIGDGIALATALQDFEYDIPITGTEISIRIKLYLDQGAEEVAFDNIRIYGVWSAVMATVSTTAISTFTSTSATMGGNATADGGASITERGVVYSSSDTTPEIGEGGVTKDTNGTGTGSFSESIASLSPATTYYVQAYAINSVGTSYGGVESFTTTGSPTVSTTAISIFTSTSAIMGGNATADGGASITERGVVYSSSDTTPEIGEGGVTKDTNGTGTGSFSESIASLSPATTYYVRAYATNENGTAYGNQIMFATEDEFPWVLFMPALLRSKSTTE